MLWSSQNTMSASHFGGGFFCGIHPLCNNLQIRHGEHPAFSLVGDIEQDGILGPLKSLIVLVWCDRIHEIVLGHELFTILFDRSKLAKDTLVALNHSLVRKRRHGEKNIRK